MNKAELINAIAGQTKLSKKMSGIALNAVIDSITGALKKGEKVTLVGFGNFSTRKRAAREGVNPQTGEKLKIPARKVPVFKAGKMLKEDVNPRAKKSKKTA